MQVLNWISAKILFLPLESPFSAAKFRSFPPLPGISLPPNNFQKNQVIFMFFVLFLCSFSSFFKNQHSAQFGFTHFYLNAKKALIRAFSVDKPPDRWYPINSYKHFYAFQPTWVNIPFPFRNANPCTDKTMAAAAAG